MDSNMTLISIIKEGEVLERLIVGSVKEYGETLTIQDRVYMSIPDSCIHLKSTSNESIITLYMEYFIDRSLLYRLHPIYNMDLKLCMTNEISGRYSYNVSNINGNFERFRIDAKLSKYEQLYGEEIND